MASYAVVMDSDDACADRQVIKRIAGLGNSNIVSFTGFITKNQLRERIIGFIQDGTASIAYWDSISMIRCLVLLSGYNMVGVE